MKQKTILGIDKKDFVRVNDFYIAAMNQYGEKVSPNSQFANIFNSVLITVSKSFGALRKSKETDVNKELEATTIHINMDMFQALLVLHDDKLYEAYQKANDHIDLQFNTPILSDTVTVERFKKIAKLFTGTKIVFYGKNYDQGIYNLFEKIEIVDTEEDFIEKGKVKFVVSYDLLDTLLYPKERESYSTMNFFATLCLTPSEKKVYSVLCRYDDVIKSGKFSRGRTYEYFRFEKLCELLNYTDSPNNRRQLNSMVKKSIAGINSKLETHYAVQNVYNGKKVIGLRFSWNEDDK